MTHHIKKWCIISLLSCIQLASLYANDVDKDNTSPNQESSVTQPVTQAPDSPIATFAIEANWQKALPEEIVTRFNNLDNADARTSIRELYTCKPSHEKSDAKKAVIIVIHGTFAQESDAYRNHKHPGFQSILRFAQYYADKHVTPVEVITFRWSGCNNSNDRIRAGQQLADLLNSSYSNYDIISIAHSHGCNVANVASHYLSAPTSFNYMIQIATPVRDLIDSRFQPNNFNKLLQFYSTSDLIAAFGSIDTKKIFNRPGSIHKYAQQQGRLVYNIRTQINAKDPGHSSIKGKGGVINYLPEILHTLENNYFYNADLDLNINSNFTADNPIFLAIRKPTTLDRTLEHSGIYAFNNTLNNNKAQDRIELEPEARTALKHNPQEQLKHEIVYSKTQEQRFEQLYNKSIHAKNALLNRIISGVALEIAPVISTKMLRAKL